MQPGPKSRRRLTGLKIFFLWAVVAGIGCADLFSPSFFTLFDTGENAAFQAIDPPTGHIPIAFLNRAQIQDEAFRFLIQGQPVVTPELVDEIQIFNPGRSDLEIEAFLNSVLADEPVNFEEWNLPPRIRVVADVTSRAGGVQRLEFLDGLRLVRGEDLVGENGNITVLPADLQQFTNIGYVAQCPIDLITVVRIEVYTPVVVRQLETVLAGAQGNQVQIVQCQGRIPPRYEVLQPDEGLDAQLGTFTITRNYDPRMFPQPLSNFTCGGVLLIAVAGELTLPFRDIPVPCEPTINPPANGRAPGFFVDAPFDVISALLIPGRYNVQAAFRTQ